MPSPLCCVRYQSRRRGQKDTTTRVEGEKEGAVAKARQAFRVYAHAGDTDAGRDSIAHNTHVLVVGRGARVPHGPSSAPARSERRQTSHHQKAGGEVWRN
eukprot:6056427-Prymnesium_polylepis.2